MEFVTFDEKHRVSGADVRRWWVLRGPEGAMSLTGIYLPESVGGVMHVRTEDGRKLMAECLTAHHPGAEECPALPDGCLAVGEAVLGAGRALAAWALICHDDAFIRRLLEEQYATHVRTYERTER